MKRLVWNNRMTPKVVNSPLVRCPVCAQLLDPYGEPFTLIKPSYEMVHAKCAPEEDSCKPS